MEIKLTHIKKRSYTYDLGDGYEKEDYEDVGEITYEVEWKDFIANEEVKNMYLEVFADYYNISEKAAEKILYDYDLYFEDYDLIEKMLKDYQEELDDIFYEEYCDEDYY